MKAGGAYIEVRADSAHLQGDLDRSHSMVTSATDKMQRYVSMALKAMAVASVAAIGLALTKSISQFTEWEVALNRLGNVSDRALGSMRKDILGMSSQLGSVTELTKGYYQVLSAGITDTNKSMKMLTVSAKMSKEAAIAQGDAVRGIVAIMGAYSNELETATDAADLLYSIEKSGITSVGELIPLIGNLANLSSAVGLSANEMAAALAQITTTGAGTSIAATQLQGLLVALNRQFTDLPPEIQKYGSAIAAVKAMGFQGVLKEIMRYTDGNATVLTKMLGRQEGYLGLLQLTKNEFGDYADRLQAMTDKTGAFDDAWKRYSETLKSIWETFKNTIGRQLVLLGEKLAPAIKKITTRMAEWVEENDDLIAQKVPEYVDKLSSALKTLVSITGSIVKGAGLRSVWDTTSQAAELSSKGLLDIIEFRSKDVFERQAMVDRIIKEQAQKGLIFHPVTRLPAKSQQPKPDASVSSVISLTEEQIKAMAERQKSMAMISGYMQAPETYKAGVQAITEEQWEKQFGLAGKELEDYNKRLAGQQDFNQQYNEMGKSRFDLEREQLDRQVELWREAKVQEDQINRLYSEKSIAITQVEQQAKLSIYSNMAGQIAGTFMQIAQAGGRQSKKAFMLYQDFAIAQAGISTAMAYIKTLAEPLLPFPSNVVMANIILGLGAVQVGMIAAAQPPSFDQGGISEAKGTYQTGNIREAHIPLPSGGKIPVKVEGGTDQQRPLQIIMNNPVFQDVETQRQVFVQIATVIAAQVAPGAVMQSYNNGEPIRDMIRGGM